MSDPFVAEIRIFAGTFAPTGWAFCNGQLMPISQNTALFSLLGTTYGGDGKSTFGLPDLQGRAPMHPGQGPGLSLRDLGEADGQPAVTLLASELPLHSHTKVAQTTPATQFAPSNTSILARSVGGNAYVTPAAPNTTLAQAAIQPAGGSAPHNNMQPFLVLNFIIALQGIFPPRGN
jgi:microcystin-dependent protein